MNEPVLTYLRLSGKKAGYLLNFGVVLMKDGISRIINGKLAGNCSSVTAPALLYYLASMQACVATCTYIHVGPGNCSCVATCTYLHVGK